MKRILPLIYTLLGLGVFFYFAYQANDTSREKDAFIKQVVEKETFTTSKNLLIKDTIYVPIYSSIYGKTKDETFWLTATLSIRNTSLSSNLYIDDIDYYDDDGVLVRAYLNETLVLKPLQSTEFVIEKDDKTGGAGANFIVNWQSNSIHIQPIIQAVMLGSSGPEGLAFVTNGVSIKRNRIPENRTN